MSSIRGICAYLLITLLLGCADRRPHTPLPEEEPSPTPAGSPSILFPHPEGWASPPSHGSWVIAYDSESCLECHQRVSAVPEDPPACSSCHPLFPHPEEWTRAENHGATALRVGRASCATQCHGPDLNGGLSGVSCTLCHAIYPHTPTWLGPTQHGETAKGNGKLLCQGCHGEDLEGGQSGIGCRECHPIYPHEAGWASREEHGGYVTEQGQGSCATQCHGLNLQGGLSGISCNSCHNLYPHPSQWEQNHGTTASNLGLGACQGCHGADYTTLLDGKNCFSCHADYPHPAPPVWTPFAGGHGERVKVTYGGSTNNCQLCHGEDLQTLKGGKNCFACHPSYPHQNQEPPAWDTYDGHGNYTLLHSKTVCQTCHGTNYQGGTRNNPSCTLCHVTYPHLDEWLQEPGQPQGHGDYVTANDTTSCATERCHGLGLVPTPGVSHGTSCSSCHSTYPHVAGWLSGVVHGPPARANISNCKSCHTDTLDFAPAGHQTCEECHPSYLQHETAEMGGVGWDTWSGHGVLLMNPPYNGDRSECQLCHGGDDLGGLSMVSCKTCHPSFPHDTPGWSGYSGHGTYVLTTLGNNKTPCKMCHGNDLMGGHSGQSCYTCHTNYPHASGWYLADASERGGAHGTAAYGTGKLNCTSANCHKADFTGNPPLIPSCIGCHADFPHTTSDWIAGPSSVHASTFISRMNALTLWGLIGGTQHFPCAECHGNNYNRAVPAAPTINCTTCHTNGVTHRKKLNWLSLISWSAGSQHGKFFSDHFTSATWASANCADCHGHPNLAVPFQNADTKPGLEAQSDCYGCHWSYPHIRYNALPGDDDAELWTVADDGNLWGPGDHAGHVFYLMQSPLLTDSGGHDPVGPGDPILIAPMPAGHEGETPALRYTCGGNSASLCHFNGYRTTPTGSTSNLCGKYCHKP